MKIVARYEGYDGVRSKSNNNEGRGTARGGRLACTEDFSRVQIPGDPLSI
jgi:hypothetical protein